jgi:uncharacterized damage-inducible protein DinB
MIAHILWRMEGISQARYHDMHSTLQHLFQYKAWANDELLTALAKLGDESPITQLAIKALSHTYVVDRIFAAHLRRKEHAYTSPNLSQLGDRIDFAFTDGAPGHMSREEMLMHVITHGVGHRGQVSAVMLLNSVAPAKDGFTTYLHGAEAEASRRVGA